MNKMYEDTKTWNPIKGCLFDCDYCKKSFQLQAKRQKHNCNDCYRYVPHYHPERLKQYLPKNKLIFACGNSDISFAKPEWIRSVLDEMRNRSEHTFLLQTKEPICLLNFNIPDNCIVGTTIETNRETYLISKAPHPDFRQYWLRHLKHKRKFVTMEPIYKFDLKIVLSWINRISPEFVYVGFANHVKSSLLEEPTKKEVMELVVELKKFTDVRLKTIRNKGEFHG